MSEDKFLKVRNLARIFKLASGVDVNEESVRLTLLDREPEFDQGTDTYMNVHRVVKQLEKQGLVQNFDGNPTAPLSGESHSVADGVLVVGHGSGVYSLNFKLGHLDKIEANLGFDFDPNS